MLGLPLLVQHDIVKEVAEKNKATPAQVILAWAQVGGHSVIPKSVTASRIEDNFQLNGWSLDDEEMKKLSSLPDRFKVCGDAWLPVKVFFGDDE